MPGEKELSVAEKPEIDQDRIKEFVEGVYAELINEDSILASKLSQVEKKLEESILASGGGVRRKADWDIKNGVIQDVINAFNNHLEGWMRESGKKQGDCWFDDAFKEQIKTALRASTERKFERMRG